MYNRQLEAESGWEDWFEKNFPPKVSSLIETTLCKIYIYFYSETVD